MNDSKICITRKGLTLKNSNLGVFQQWREIFCTWKGNILFAWKRKKYPFRISTVFKAVVILIDTCCLLTPIHFKFLTEIDFKCSEISDLFQVIIIFTGIV